MTAKVLISCASGAMGRQSIKHLSSKDGLELLPACRSEASFAAFRELGLRPRRLDFDAPASWPEALAGIDRLVLLIPKTLFDADAICDFVRSAASAGVQQIITVAGLASRDGDTALAKFQCQIDDCVKAEAPSWTQLQAGVSMEILLQLADSKRGELTHYFADDAALAWLADGDLARAIARVACDPQAYAGKTLPLVGELITTVDLLQLLCDTSAHDYEGRRLSREQALSLLTEAAWAPARGEAELAFFEAINRGDVNMAQYDAPNPLGFRLMNLCEFMVTHRSVFQYG